MSALHLVLRGGVWLFGLAIVASFAIGSVLLSWDRWEAKRRRKPHPVCALCLQADEWVKWYHRGEFLHFACYLAVVEARAMYRALAEREAR